MMAVEFQLRLDPQSGVPIYRQIIDQILVAIASGSLAAGAQLPTVRQVAVDLAINPNTVVRAYRELEIRGTLETQQGTGTFVTTKSVTVGDVERRRQLSQLVSELVARAARAGFTARELLEHLQEYSHDTNVPKG